MAVCHPTEIARELVFSRFPSATVALLCGSAASGRFNARSDLDIIVVVPSVERASREAFLYSDWPVELYIHDIGTLRYCMEVFDHHRGIPCTASMVLSSMLICGEAERLDDLRRLATAALDRGPHCWSSRELEGMLHRLSLLCTDLRDERSTSEMAAIAVELFRDLACFSLRGNGLWHGQGKFLALALDSLASGLSNEFACGLLDVLERRDSRRLVSLTERLTEPFGGLSATRLRDSAPKEWRV